MTRARDLPRRLVAPRILLGDGNVIGDGKPTAAIRTYRERYAVDEPEDENAEPVGTGELTITGVRVLDGSGASGSSFVPGDDVGIELEVTAHAPVPAWVCGVEIRNQVDTLVFGTNSDLLGVTLPAFSAGVRRIRFTLPRIPMTEGVYAVTVAVHPPAAVQEFHRLDRTVAFTVRSRADQTGVVVLTAGLQVL